MIGYCGALVAPETLAAEVLPLLAAAKFLEREAAAILAPRQLGADGRPVWLSGLRSIVERVPLGRVLVIGPANYPLFLPGVQVLQALAAGNSVVWKPGSGGRAVALVFAQALERAGLPQGVLYITGESTEDGLDAVAARPDKIFFTGSEAAGKAVLRMAAESVIPVVAELSGCDAVIAIPSADLARLRKALCFGLRLNGSATCMAPRRLFLLRGDSHAWSAWLDALQTDLASLSPVTLAPATQTLLRELVEEACREGAVLSGALAPLGQPQSALLLRNATPSIRIARTDLFAPILSVLEVEDEHALLGGYHASPLALTASIFGEEHLAASLAARLTAGSVLINDLIVPTADPRLPFGGRRASGFGVTRGREGLLEMTAAKSTIIRGGRATRHFEPTTAAHEALFAGFIRLAHGKGFAERWAGLTGLVRAGRAMPGTSSAKPQEKS